MPDGSSMPIPLPSNQNGQPSSVQSKGMNLMSNSCFSSYASYTPSSAPQSTGEQPSFPPCRVTSPPVLNEQNNKKVKKRSQPNKRKKSKVEMSDDDVQTTTLKSIRNVLVETAATSQLERQLDHQLNQKLDRQLSQRTGQPHSPGQTGQTTVPESNHSQSSQCSTNSSMFSRSNRESNDTFSQSNSMAEDGTSSTANTKSKPGRRAKNQPKEDTKEKKARSLERNRVSKMVLISFELCNEIQKLIPNLVSF